MIETYLVRNAERALALRKANAALHSATLGEDITTPFMYLSSSWEVFGDARRLVSAQERTLLMFAALQRCAQDEAFPLRATIGTARLLASFVSRFAGEVAFQACVERIRADDPLSLDLSPSERAALDCVAQYFESLDERGLIEPGCAACMLTPLMQGTESVHSERLFVTASLEHMFAALGAEQPAAAPIQALPAGVEPQFAFAAGATMATALMKQQIELCLEKAAKASIEQPRICLFCTDARHAFRVLAPVLASQGARSILKCRLEFSETHLGRAIRALSLVRSDQGDARSALTDFAYDPLSGISMKDAEGLNTALRQDSLMTSEEALERVTSLSPTYEHFKQLLEAPCADTLQALLDAFENAGCIPRDAREEEAAAASALGSLLDQAADLGLPDAVFEVVDDLTCALTCASIPSASQCATIECLSMEMLDSLAPGSAFAVIVTDMTRTAHSIPKAHPATESILEKLGIEDARDAFEQKRCAFSSALQAPTHVFSTITSLRDESGAETYPSFLFDEYIASLGAEELIAVDVEKLYWIPAAYKDEAKPVSEADVVVGFGETFADPERELCLRMPVRGRLDSYSTHDIMCFAHSDGDEPSQTPRLSASQIELYTHCPYSWFISRKIGIRPIDETLDAKSTGTLAHKVLEETFKELASRGIHQVTQETLPEVLEVARTQFDRLSALQPTLKPLERCVASSLADEEVLRGLRESILDACTFMVELPADFSLRSEELEIIEEDGIDVAGARIQAKIDRIDVDERGHFAILDYKGSLMGHEAGCSSLDDLSLPQNIQALIYAIAVGRMPAYAEAACAGALYLSYRAREENALTCGSFDPALYDATATSSKKSIVSVPFEAFLEAVEHLIAASVERMVEGRIEIDPRFDACTWCPYTFCRMRRAG